MCLRPVSEALEDCDCGIDTDRTFLADGCQIRVAFVPDDSTLDDINHGSLMWLRSVLLEEKDKNEEIEQRRCDSLNTRTT